MKLRLGFIGLGAMGLSHARAFREEFPAQVEVACVCARNEEHLRAALQFAPAARVLDEAALLASDVHAVVISTPNFTHARLAREALAAGKHVFLEKPCGITAEECAELVRANDASERIVIIGHELRYSPYFRRIHELIAAGEIGTPRMAWTSEFRGPFQKKSADWIQDARRSGGTLVDKNCHHFDLMNWWLQSRPTRVAAFGGCAVNKVRGDEHEVNDHAAVSWEYASGARGSLQLCMFAREFPEEELEMGVVGDAGSLQTRLATLEILQWRRKPGSGIPEPLVHKVDATRGGGWGGHLGFHEIHRAFVDAIISGQKPLTAPRACVDGTLLAIAAEESIRRGVVVDVNSL